jgi:hydroxyethylthiazole kinase
MRAPQNNLPDIAAAVLAQVRRQAPRVHCITNTVAQTSTANVLLAVGARPSMTIAPEEVAAFVASSDALLINLGTFDSERRKAIEIAVAKAVDGDVPWVLDPVFIERVPARATFASALAGKRPRAVRLNRAELAVLASTDGEPGNDRLQEFASARDTVVALTGAIDRVVDATRLATIANGHALMGRITAMGCNLSALVAACAAVESDAWRATVAALSVFGVAGEIAGERARGPGSFVPEFLDALYGLDRDTIITRAMVT